jgi:hypothetical protein
MMMIEEISAEFFEDSSALLQVITARALATN